MRQIFYTLVGVNLLIFGWGTLFAGVFDHEAQSGVSAPNVTKRIGDKGGSGLPGGAREAGLAIGGASSVGVDNAGSLASQGLCEIVGPFSELGEADAFMQRLQAIDVRSSRHELELSVGSNYWVYLSPRSSRKDAQRELKKLQSLGVDSYVVPKGDYLNAISLGMFSRKNLADAVVNRLKDEKYSPELKIIDRTQMETWVMVSPLDGDKMSDLTWNRVMKELNNQERRQNFCLDVASGPNFQ